MTKKPETPETLDCVAVKRRTQRALTRALADKSPAEQAETLHRLAAQAPLWRRLTKVRRGRPFETLKPRGKRRSAG